MPNSENGQLPEFIGKRVDPTYSKILQQKLKELLHTTSDSINSFPGSQPVCFESKHLIDIEREDYYVCERSDGVRYLLLFVQSPKGPASFLYDRNRYWYYVPNLLFPTRGRENEYLKDTLMDGELVLDIDDKKKTWRYLIFDLMVVNGLSIVQRSFNTRLGMLQQDVIQPLNMGLRNLTETDRPPFSVELKKMERSYGLHLVFDQIPKLKHKTDGIIWTPVKYPYTSGTCQKLLKWKPPESNTVDFRIAARWSKEHKPIYSIEVLSHGVTYKFYDHFQPEPALATEYDPNCEVTIVEQGYAPTVRKGGWRFVRFRDDKGIANDENVVKKILNSIKDGVTKEQLLSCMDRVRAAWKAREKGLPMPPLPSKHALKSPSFDQNKADINSTSTIPAAATSSKIISDTRPNLKQSSSFDNSDIPARFIKRKTSETSFSVKKETSEGIDGNLPERKKLKGTIKSKGDQLKEFADTTENDSIANDTQVAKQVEDDHSAQFERIISDSETEYLKNELSLNNIDSALQEKQADVKATVAMERTLKEVDSVKQSPNNESNMQGKHSLPADIQKKVENIPDATVQTSSLLEHATERRRSHTRGLDGFLSTKQQLKNVPGTCSSTYPSLVSKEQEMIQSSNCLKDQGVASKRVNNPLFEAFPATSENKSVTEGDQKSIKVRQACSFEGLSQSKMTTATATTIAKANYTSTSNSDMQYFEQERGRSANSHAFIKVPPISQNIEYKPRSSSLSNIHHLLSSSEELGEKNERNNSKDISNANDEYKSDTFLHSKMKARPQLQHHITQQSSSSVPIEHEQADRTDHQYQQQHLSYLQKHTQKAFYTPVQFINFHAERRTLQGLNPRKDQFLIFQSESNAQPLSTQPKQRSYSNIWKTNSNVSNFSSDCQPCIHEPESPQQSKGDNDPADCDYYRYGQQVAHTTSQREKPRSSNIKSKLDFILN
ncbi:hypothetical protein G6F70_009028 [Rhizopus microsporus]|nr:hypothetical protein G6F71_008974 [Rhizopus microsporus]KAG1193694.1 hypothetical protein G6F70_009028 [Rhizopus microsporus]KAG1207993.1 hypothetical protein G6F69_007597 [Rhizopus microsporus]KAG1227605.1 hypothetical protein G6F67_008349 [Rhizopus microsporus]KAG1257989.1 hypothetical protein G6F68_009023 [Rhizopus microsporus]